MKYEERVMSVLIAPKGEPSFSEMATIISIDDEAAGEFVTVQAVSNGESISIDIEEWPIIREAINKMIDSCRKN